MKTDKTRVFNMDCMEYMKDIPDGYFELAIVDPPYGIGEANGKNNSRNKGFGKGVGKSKKITYSKDYGIKKWDSNAPDCSYFTELKRVSKNQIIFGANHFIENIPSSNSSCWVIWDKDNGNSDFADAELAYTSFKTAVRIHKFRWNGLLQHDMKNKEIRLHPTQKPVKLYEWLLINYAKEGDKIFDSHLGSGSSRIASYNLGFDFTGIELDKEYFDASVKRFENHKKQLTLF